MRDKINQYDEQGNSQGYWHSQSGIYYYKCYYIKGETFGYYEHHFLSDNGKIVKEYYAK
jgi:hypothetical protein